MQNALVVATLGHTSGFTEDNVVNTFAVDTAATVADATAAAQLVTAVTNFYNANQSTTRSIAYYLSPVLKRTTNGCRMQVYDLTGAEGLFTDTDGKVKVMPHGSPILDTTWTLAAAAASETPLPEQVALVATLRGEGFTTAPVERPDGSDPGTKVDRPKARHSGRLFLGPLNMAADAGTTDSTPSRPLAAFITTILDAAEDLRDELFTNLHEWSVWSRSDATLYNVASVSVDNRWDTIRKRLTAPTARTERIVFP